MKSYFATLIRRLHERSARRRYIEELLAAADALNPGMLDVRERKARNK